jgi:hypothetical protein
LQQQEVPSITFTEPDGDQTGSTTLTFDDSTAGSDVCRQDSQQEKSPKIKKPKKGLLRACFSPFIEFYQQMTNPKYNAVTDVYATMFLCDFITFLIVVFGYWAFGPAEAGGGTETVASVIQENKVCSSFVRFL